MNSRTEETDRKIENLISISMVGGVVGLIALYFTITLTPLNSCIDRSSGNVPKRAEQRMAQRIIEDAIIGDYRWASSMSKATNQEQIINTLKEAQPYLSYEYEIRSETENTGRLYIQGIEFDTGLILVVWISGEWPSCLDFNVTAQEIEENLRLIDIWARIPAEAN